MKKISYRISQVICWIGFLAYLLVLWELVINKGMFFGGRQLSLKPFVFLTDYMKGNTDLSLMLKNSLGNVGVFIPLGIILPALFQKLRARTVILLGCLTSLLIEIIQFILVIGIADIDDLILNTAGVCIGALFYFGISKRLDNKFGNLFGTILLVVVIGVICAYILWFFGYAGNLFSFSRPTKVKNEEVLDGLLDVSSDYNLMLTDTSTLSDDILTGENDIYDESTDAYSNETVSLALDDSTEYFNCSTYNKYTPNGNVRSTTVTYDKLTQEEWIELVQNNDSNTWVDVWCDQPDTCKAVMIYTQNMPD